MSQNQLIRILVVVGLLPCAALNADAGQTVGLFQNDAGSFEGYTLFTPLSYDVTYLIDHDGFLVHSWQASFVPGNSEYLLSNGHLLRTSDPGGNGTFVAGGDAGLVEEYDWDGTLLWEFLYSSTQVRHHHDVEPLPNGNVLMIAWEYKSGAEAIQAGRNPSNLPNNEMWPDHIIEVEPVGASGGNIVWEWHAWDHLVQDFDATKDNFGVVADHPELIDINAGGAGADWMHANAIDYNAELDQILLSVPFFHEFWIIDHSTTTAEAAGHTGGARGHGGDILYRWGNPRNHGAGDVGDQKLFNQHHVNWIAPGLPGAGHIMIFNNGLGRPGGDFSSVEELETTADVAGDYPLPAPGMPHGPAGPVWTYTATPPSAFFAAFISGAERLPNGNTIVCNGPAGRFFEVTPAGDQVWLYVNPVNANGPITQGDPPAGNLAFRVQRLAPDYSGFDGRDLTPLGTIELPAVAIAEVPVGIPPGLVLRGAYPSPFFGETRIAFSIERPQPVALRIYNVLGQHVATLVDRVLPAGAHDYAWNPRSRPAGVYHYTVTVGGESRSGRVILAR